MQNCPILTSYKKFIFFLFSTALEKWAQGFGFALLLDGASAR